MKKTILRNPIMLYEALEMVRAFVNDIPAAKIAGNGAYSIPQEKVSELMAIACGELDKEDPDLKFYFQTYPLDDSKFGEACVARALIYWTFNLKCSDFDMHVDMLLKRWAELRQHPLEITGISAFAPDFEDLPQEGRTSLAATFCSLSLDRFFTAALVEAFTDYDFYVKKLAHILHPVAERLEPLLEPFVQAAQPHMNEWEEFLKDASVENFLLQRGGVIDDKVYDELVIAFRFIDAGSAPGNMSDSQMTIWLHVGITLPVGMKRSGALQPMSENKYEAFRLLADRSRADMVRILSDKPLKMKDIATRLDINPGTVFRNLNSLNNSGLLIKEYIGGRYLYRTNKELLRSTLRDITAYLEGGEDSDNQ